jgi:hypothetical protein
MITRATITQAALHPMLVITFLLSFSFGQGNPRSQIQETGPSVSVPVKTVEHAERERLQKMFELRQTEIRRDAGKMAKFSAELK